MAAPVRARAAPAGAERGPRQIERLGRRLDLNNTPKTDLAQSCAVKSGRVHAASRRERAAEAARRINRRFGRMTIRWAVELLADKREPAR